MFQELTKKLSSALESPGVRGVVHAGLAGAMVARGVFNCTIRHTVATEAVVVTRMLLQFSQGINDRGARMRFMAEHFPHMIAGVVGQVVAASVGVPKEYIALGAVAADATYVAGRAAYQYCAGR